MTIINFSYMRKINMDHLADFFLEPARILLGGRKVVAATVFRNGTFHYQFYSMPNSLPTWLEKSLAIVAFIPGFFIGMALKMLSREENLRLSYEQAEGQGQLLQGNQLVDRPIAIIGPTERLVELYKIELLQRIVPHVPIQGIVNHFHRQEQQVLSQAPCDIYLIQPSLCRDQRVLPDPINDENIRALLLNQEVNQAIVYYMDHTWIIKSFFIQ